MRGETCGGVAEIYVEQISIHSPHARGDAAGEGGQAPAKQFQSTPLMRGETVYPRGRGSRKNDFNPLPSCEGRRAGAQLFFAPLTISIHSPHARGDNFPHRGAPAPRDFNPLPSCEGRRGRGGGRGTTRRISIHSPHARGDAYGIFSSCFIVDFNPLPSHEGRRDTAKTEKDLTRFQSTPLTRGETRCVHRLNRRKLFQSTPLMRGETAPERLCL